LVGGMLAYVKPPAPVWTIRIEVSRDPQDKQRSALLNSSTVMPSGTLDRSSPILCSQASH
jgi:hypothetical protein